MLSFSIGTADEEEEAAKGQDGGSDGTGVDL